MLQLAKQVHAKFQLSSLDSTQTDLDKFLTIFHVNIRIFLKISNSEQSFKQSILKSIFYQNLSHLAFW
jgi:hypothetical protein